MSVLLALPGGLGAEIAHVVASQQLPEGGEWAQTHPPARTDSAVGSIAGTAPDLQESADFHCQ